MTSHSPSPLLSIIIVNWNTGCLLRECLDSLVPSAASLPLEILVVDNDSRDTSLEECRQAHPQARYLMPGRNLGFAGANNLALRECLGSQVLFLNPDTVVKGDAVVAMSRFLTANPGYGAVGCRLLLPGGAIQLTCAAGFPSPRRELNLLFGLHRLAPRLAAASSRELEHWDHLDPRDVECLSGACIMSPTSFIRGLGGFDESYFMYGEDVDLCFRIRAAGMRIRYLAGPEIIHLGGASSSKTGASFFATSHQLAANHRFLRKNLGRGTAILFRIAVFSGGAFRLLGSAILSPLAASPKLRPILARQWGKARALLRWSLAGKVAAAGGQAKAEG